MSGPFQDDAGDSVVLIEHDLDVISEADLAEYVIDLGPDGGAKEGQVVAARRWRP
jgi:excinuclease ABC subunit A